MSQTIDTFRRVVIDNYTGPEITNFSDLRKHYGTGQEYLISKNPVKKTGYRIGVQTNIGDIEEHEWQRLVEKLIERNDEKELFDQLVSWLVNTDSSLDAKKAYNMALELHAARIFDNEAWYDFLLFNEKYRPERLKTASIVTIIPNCCQKGFQMTEKRAEKCYGNQIYCPHCGEYVAFEIRKESNTNE